MNRIPTFLISLKKAETRRANTLGQLDSEKFDITLIDAVNGKELSEEFIKENCDASALIKHPTWLTRGAIGCALSHLEVYQQMVANNLKYSLVLEDDKDYSAQFPHVCAEVIENMKSDEVCLMYYESHIDCEYSTQSAVKLSNDLQKVYPIDKSGPITTGAYLIGIEAARKLAANILPIRVAADTWHYFISQGYLTHLSCAYPLVVQDANFRSEIGYSGENSLRDKISGFVESKQIPILNTLLKRRRGTLRNERQRFSLVDKPDYRFQEKE